MLELGASTAAPFTLKVAPSRLLNVPVLSSSVRLKMPLLTCTKFALAQGTETVVVPVPPVLRKVPAFARLGELPDLTNAVVLSAVKSSVPDGVLLNRAVL